MATTQDDDQPKKTTSSSTKNKKNSRKVQGATGCAWTKAYGSLQKRKSESNVIMLISPYPDANSFCTL
jgi:hypothetical protein